VDIFVCWYLELRVFFFFFFSFFVGFMYSDDGKSCIWVTRVILFQFFFFLNELILLIVYGLESCAGEHTMYFLVSESIKLING
jgi:hypothetical protein